MESERRDGAGGEAFRQGDDAAKRRGASSAIQQPMIPLSDKKISGSTSSALFDISAALYAAREQVE